mgnify:CR=1 FL=1
MANTRRSPFPYLDGPLPPRDAEALMQVFKALANPTRLLLLHAIHRAGEISPSDLAEQIGASPQAVSNHLQRLADQGIVGTRREGQRVLYNIIDPCVPGLMNLGVCLVQPRPQAT